MRWLGLQLSEYYLPVYADRKIKRRTALKNMNALLQEYADVLRFVKSHNMKRFIAPANNTVLHQMHKACLLEIDDPNWSAFAITTYYVVPDYVWSAIELGLKAHPVPQLAPWAAMREDG